MTSTQSTASGEHHGEGVYYAPEDYASLSTRIVVLCIDASVLILLLAIIMLAWLIFSETDLEAMISAISLTWLAAAYGYMAILKPTTVGTLGYRLMGIRIVTLKGERPSLLVMSFRFILLLVGPLNQLLDILWLGGDEHKQALRDKLAGTYVIKRKAIPQGQGPIAYVAYDLFGWNLLFREVKAPPTSS